MGDPNRFMLGNTPKIGEAGRKSERAIAKAVGGRLTPGSGNQRGAKGDARVPRPRLDALMESKSTVNATLPLERHWLRKIAGEALAVGKTPILSITFTDASGKPRPGETWIAMPLSAFQELTE